MNNFIRYSLTRDFDYPKYNFFKTEFWNDPNLFKDVEFEKNIVKRFKLKNIVIENYNEKIYDYVLRKKYVIKK